MTDETMAVTVERIAEIRARVEKAAAGPWEAVPDECAKCRADGTSEWDIYEIEGGHHAKFGRRDDADFIAHAREDIPYLLAELTALQEAVRELKDARAQCDDYLDNGGNLHEAASRYKRAIDALVAEGSD